MKATAMTAFEDKLYVIAHGEVVVYEIAILLEVVLVTSTISKMKLGLGSDAYHCHCVLAKIIGFKTGSHTWGALPSCQWAPPVE